MMRLRINFLLVSVFMGTLLFSCKDDDDGFTPPPLRDESVVAEEDDIKIRNFLETHFYEMVPNPLNPNYQIIQFGEIEGENAGEQPIMDSQFLKTKTILQNDVEYTLYYLKIREGAPSKPKPTFADITIVTYQGQLLDLTEFDESVSPISFNLPGASGGGGVIKGFVEAVTEFRGASSYTENPDNTIEFSDDFGIGAVFVPSGLAYFATSPSSLIPQYSPLIFTFQLYETVQQDHDGDGLPSFYEDLNGNKNLLDDNSNPDNTPNFGDPDDDGDGILTEEELEISDSNLDGYISQDEITFTDSDSDGTPDYLDPEE